MPVAGGSDGGYSDDRQSAVPKACYLDMVR
jgi:hypothetical protein